MDKGWALLLTATIAGLGHSLAPDHWLTYVLTAKAKHLTQFRAIKMTVTGAVSHLISTIILGLLIAYVGQYAGRQYTAGLGKIVSFIVILLGLYFIRQALLGNEDADISDHGAQKENQHHGSDYLIGAFLGIRACPEAIPIFLAISAKGVFSSLIAIAIWVTVTVGSLVGIVWLSFKGLEIVRLTWLERHGELLSGVFIVLIGLITLII